MNNSLHSASSESSQVMCTADSTPTRFTSLPNEIVLIIWMHLSHAEAMRSFGTLKCQRYTRLLRAYCYSCIDFHATTLSTFQLCCTYMLDEFRTSVRTLKLGHRDSYSQLRLFSHYCLGERLTPNYSLSPLDVDNERSTLSRKVADFCTSL